MMLYRPSFWVLLLIALGWSVYQIKYEVQQKEAALTRLNRAIARTEEDVRILRAEWSHLTEPGRLEQQNAAFLGLVPLKPQQITLMRHFEPSPRDHAASTGTPVGEAAAGFDRSSLQNMMQAVDAPPKGGKHD